MKNKGEILATILKDFKDCYFFLHNTKELNAIESIMDEGFIFESQLSHSTDRINPNVPIEVTYFLVQRKDYGSYTIIIAIPKTIYDIYTGISNKYGVSIEEVLTSTDPYYSDNDELIYTVPSKHILGYFNIISSEFYQNGNWDPSFNNTRFRSQGKRPVKPFR